LSEEAKMSYANVLAAARKKIPLKEIGVDSVDMKEAMDIIIRVPGDKDRGKTSLLAARLPKVLDPSAVRVAIPTRTAEVVGLDISVDKEELRHALASRGGLGLAWIRCAVAGARKLGREGKVMPGWSKARVIAIPKRPLQCYKCLELGHVRATCVSTMDRVHLCYRCGGSGHRARGCPASVPKCPLCQSLGGLVDHRIGGISCAPPPRRSTRRGDDQNANQRRNRGNQVAPLKQQ
jgi:hypothetical protein